MRRDCEPTFCPECSTPVENRDAARRRLLDGKPDIACSYCEARITLWDAVEQRVASLDVGSRVEEMRVESQIVLDAESRGRLLVGEVYAMAARANQIAREILVSDHGLDMEIEFRDDDGNATGKKLYLHLESDDDSYLRRQYRDESRTFRIENLSHADYWADEEAPVVFIVRDWSGAIEWMEIGSFLRRQRAEAKWPPTEIVFTGKRFDVMSVRRWRHEALTTRASLGRSSPGSR